MKHIGTYKIPTCYVNYIANADASGLTDLDVELVNAFLDSEFSHHGFIVDWCGIDEPYFSAYPDIGSLGAEVVDADFYYA
jgi:hypothetical protein